VVSLVFGVHNRGDGAGGVLGGFGKFGDVLALRNESGRGLEWMDESEKGVGNTLQICA
jgi:hypothetical protein